MDSIDLDKKEQRKTAKMARAIAHKEQPNAGQVVAQHWHAAGLLKTPSIISIYWPLGDELDPLPLLTQLHEKGHQMVLPVMLGAGKPLIFRTWAPGDTLKEAGFGTKEPTDDKEALDPDVILAPLLAYDEEGYRLGYGGGFYDRTLEKLRQKKQVSVYGIAYAAQQMPQVVRGEYDQPLDGMVTEQGMISF